MIFSPDGATRSAGGQTSNDPCGRDRPPIARRAGAEGATAPETLRHPDRRVMNLWKAGAREARLTEGVSPDRDAGG